MSPNPQLEDPMPEESMRRYRILKYPWHTPHDYELAKLPHDFFYLSSTHRQWATSQREIPSNIEWVPNPSSVETDVMILHTDQWTLQEPSKRYFFRTYMNAYPGPKIVINHGCNLVDGCSSEDMAEFVQGCTMVCNSSTAQEHWNIPNSRFIRHGMSPEEWPSTDYAVNNVVVIQHYGNTHREYRNVDAIESIAASEEITWVGRDRKFNSWQKYKTFLQSSSILLHTSMASPNPRARTEAMLSGLVIVTTNNHGEDEYIKNGVNGYCSNDIGDLLEAIRYLKANPREARRIGQAGRETAHRVFHIDQFIKQWNDLLADELGSLAA